MCTQNNTDKSFKDAMLFMQFENTPTMKEHTNDERTISKVQENGFGASS